MDEILAGYDLPNVFYKNISALLQDDMDKGLERETNSLAVVKMFPTYVRSLPDGSEHGNYLAVDFGGTNLRVLLVKLEGTEPEVVAKLPDSEIPIPLSIRTGTGTELFDHIARLIFRVLSNFGWPTERELLLGFTFSFACKQKTLKSGILTKWNKDITCDGVEGQDVVQLLQDAINRRKDFTVKCVALLNDTVACLVSCACLIHNTQIGVIIGTGTNACYMEELDRVKLWDGDNNEPKQMIINTEWGAFGDDRSLDVIRTEEDKDIDRASQNPGKQTFEKMISGKYIGEITRRVLVKCFTQGLLFEGGISTELNTSGKFKTKHCSIIDTDSEADDFQSTRYILHNKLSLKDITVDDCRKVQQVCAAVSKRAAFLAAAGIATLLNRIDKPDVTVAMDGKVYSDHPRFRDLMLKIRQLVRPNTNFQLELSKEGSGKGAALLAAMAWRLDEENQANSNIKQVIYKRANSNI